MRECSNCNKEIEDNEKVLIIEDGRGFCSNCYIAKPYTAYVYEDDNGNFLGISQDCSEGNYDKDYDGFY